MPDCGNVHSHIGFRNPEHGIDRLHLRHEVYTKALSQICNRITGQIAAVFLR